MLTTLIKLTPEVLPVHSLSLALLCGSQLPCHNVHRPTAAPTELTLQRPPGPSTASEPPEEPQRWRGTGTGLCLHCHVLLCLSHSQMNSVHTWFSLCFRWQMTLAPQAHPCNLDPQALLLAPVVTSTKTWYLWVSGRKNPYSQSYMHASWERICPTE